MISGLSIWAGSTSIVLIKCIKEKYEHTKDWSGDLYCGIKLRWDYNARTVNISMLGYIKKLLQKYKHKMPIKPQHCPYTPAPIPANISPKLSNKEIKEIQRIVKGFCITRGWSTSQY
jgi:hypothetical protein